MGLDCSHDAFSGSYGAFNRFRKAVAQAIGGDFPPYMKGETLEDGTLKDDRSWYWPQSRSKDTSPGLYEFLCHSDCDGSIPPELCNHVADELESILPELKLAGSGAGHIERDGGYEAVARKFIAGCRWAAEENEPLDFD